MQVYVWSSHHFRWICICRSPYHIHGSELDGWTWSTCFALYSPVYTWLVKLLDKLKWHWIKNTDYCANSNFWTYSTGCWNTQVTQNVVHRDLSMNTNISFWNLFFICRNLFVLRKEERWTQGFMDKGGTKNTLPSHPRGSINKPVIASTVSILGVRLQETYSKS